MSRDIEIDTELPYAVADVWHALTDPAALAEWLMPVEGFAPKVGQAFTLRAKPMPGWDGVVECEVITADEPHTLAYTWRGSRMSTPSTVTWTLSPLDARRTRLRLDHGGFSGLSGTVMAFLHRGGWGRIVHRRLADHLRRAAAKDAR